MRHSLYIGARCPSAKHELHHTTVHLQCFDHNGNNILVSDFNGSWFKKKVKANSQASCIWFFHPIKVKKKESRPDTVTQVVRMQMAHHFFSFFWSLDKLA